MIFNFKSIQLGIWASLFLVLSDMSRRQVEKRKFENKQGNKHLRKMHTLLSLKDIFRIQPYPSTVWRCLQAVRNEFKNNIKNARENK